MRKTVILALTPALLSAAPALAGWEVTDANLGTIVMGVDFTDTTTGWVAGAANGSGPMIWKSTDGGDSWRVNNDDMLTMAYMDISMSGGALGVTGGMGAFWKWAGSTRTADGGRTWSKAGGRQFFAVYQDVETVDDDHAVLVGSWGDLRTYAYGVAVTGDQGLTWDYYDWGIDTWARYTSFPTAQTGFISGGEWPSDTARAMTPYDGRSVSQYVRLPRAYGVDDERVESTGYRGVVARSADGGASWESVLDVDGLYFNGIDFVDEMNGWVVGEGASSASIYHTADGGATWEEQWTGTATLMSVKMVNSRVGWAAGGDLSGVRPTALILHTTDGGKTWSPDPIDASFILFNIDAVDAEHAWGVGYNLSSGNCGVLRYTATP